MISKKHADVIRAWLDGAEVEFKFGEVWMPASTPTFKDDTEFRVKPEPTVKLDGIELTADEAALLYGLINAPSTRIEDAVQFIPPDMPSISQGHVCHVQYDLFIKLHNVVREQLGLPTLP